MTVAGAERLRKRSFLASLPIYFNGRKLGRDVDFQHSEIFRVLLTLVFDPGLLIPTVVRTERALVNAFKLDLG